MANIIVRIPDNLHQAARIAAAITGGSLNTWIVRAIQGQAMREALRPGGQSIAAAIDPDSKSPLARRR